MDHDLHSLLSAARDDAPPPRLSVDDITAAGRQLVRRRRRNALLTSVAGGIAAVITGATAAVVLFSPPAIGPSVDPNGNPGLADVSQSPARRTGFVTAAAFETNYSGYTSGQYIVSDPDLVTTTYQQSSIDLNPAAPVASPAAPPALTPSGARDTGPGAPPGASRSVSPSAGRQVVPREGRLVVYGAGVFDPREFTGGQKLEIAGRTALLRHSGSLSMPSTVTEKYGCCMTPTVPTIAWQYLPDAWAAIYWSSFETAPVRDELVALAEAMPADDPHPFPAGIRMREIPKGYFLVAVSTRKSSYDETNLSVVRLAPKPVGTQLVTPIDFEKLPSIVLTLGVADQAMNEEFAKFSCPPGGNVCATLFEDGQYFLQVESIGDRPLSTAELTLFLKAMTAEQPDDRTTWPAATSIFKS